MLERVSRNTGRSLGSISLRFANFNSVDPTFTTKGLKGMSGGGATVKAIWHEFSNNEGWLDQSKLLSYIAVQWFEVLAEGESNG